MKGEGLGVGVWDGVVFFSQECKRIAWAMRRGVRLRGCVRAVLRGARLGRGVMGFGQVDCIRFSQVECSSGFI